MRFSPLPAYHNSRLQSLHGQAVAKSQKTTATNPILKLKRELEKELRLTALLLAERQQGKTLDETVMAKLLDSASDKLVGLLDEKIKERVETEVRKSSGSSLNTSTEGNGVRDGHANGRNREMDAVSGALEAVSLGAGDSA